MNKWKIIEQLKSTGISEADAIALRRISMTLQRWYELECGDGYGFIQRDEETGKPRYINTRYDHTRRGYFIPDREGGALKRLAVIMARYPGLEAYIQSDPRGAALYILRPGDVPAGKDADAFYDNGIAVYK